ncbi:MAG: excinuclease ABC subunit UvrC [Thermoproteota archaeon]|nr:excinuclease ABC subunit UvrC [Thermoproteota archaeon]
MKDIQEKIIYIGKAKNLNKRIKSYFSKDNYKSRDKTFILISRIKKIDYIITDNEIEAFLLESNLIKKYRPLFNIELKDQQKYTYLKITDEKFPRLLVTRRNRNGEFMGPKGEIFGPFVKGSSRFLTIGLLRKMFKIRICKQLPKKECLEYHIGNCDAPCINKISQVGYNKNIELIKNILKINHDFDEFYLKLENEMKVASENKEYEKAIHIRDTLFRLKNLRYHQKIENTFQNNPIEEYIGIIYEKIKNIAYVMTLISKNGVINDMKKYQFDLIADNSFENFISQYYYSNPTIPNTIYLNEEVQEKSKLELVLKKISGHMVKIKNISSISNQTSKQERGNKIDSYYNNSNQDVKESENQKNVDKVKIMDLIICNLKTYIQKSYEPALEELKISLNLKKIPHIIDCFDISNFGNDFAVGACTRFIDGVPHKNGYRRFKIKKTFNQNDFSMMEEIIIRRYKINDSQQKAEKEKDVNQTDNRVIMEFSEAKAAIPADELPNLIIIDGGIGHLNVALKALKKIGQEKLECVSLAKENEEIFVSFSNDPIIIPKNKKSLRILQHIRDESHRFGLTYNKKLRKITI